MHRPLFTAACVLSACLWLGWMLLAFFRFTEFPLELDTAVADGLVGLAMLAVIPALWVHVRDREREAAARCTGLCRSCGYDLTGNVSGVCPECGSIVVNRARRS